MTDKRPVGHAAKLDETFLAAHPELAVLTLDLPDNDGEPMENERDRLQMNLVLDVLDHYWKDRQDFYAAGNMFLYYCSEQARQIIDEVAEQWAEATEAEVAPLCAELARLRGESH